METKLFINLVALLIIYNNSFVFSQSILPESSNHEKPNLFITVDGGINSTFVNGTKSKTTGHGIAFSVGLLIKEAFSVSLGIEGSTVKYTGKGDDYMPPKGFWTNSTIPSSVTATCKLLEIPLIIGYHFPQIKSEKFKVYLNTGLLSVLVLDEHYQYHYENPDPILIQEWSEKNKHKHIMSVANFEAVLGIKVNESVLLGIAPFAKVALAGIGHGEVEFDSIGIKAVLDFEL